MSLAGISAFIVSFALLSAGVTSMPLRYAVAGLSGYMAFLALLGLYIAWRRRLEGEIEIIDALDGGRHFHPSLPSERSSEASGIDHASEGSWLHGFDDFGWILVVVVAAVAGVLAVASIVWAAPVLLAEVLVDALIVSTVSHHLAHRERRDWTMTAIRRTWIPATILIVAVVAGAWALQHIAPDATSIGPAMRALSGR